MCTRSAPVLAHSRSTWWPRSRAATRMSPVNAVSTLKLIAWTMPNPRRRSARASSAKIERLSTMPCTSSTGVVELSMSETTRLRCAGDRAAVRWWTNVPAGRSTSSTRPHG